RSLTTLARAESRAETLNHTTTDMNTIVSEACRRSEPLAEAKQIHFDCAIPDGPIQVNADANALQRLFLILIDNAVKYTPSGGRIRVVLEAKTDHVIVSIQDTGTGISAEDRAFIFD